MNYPSEGMGYCSTCNKEKLLAEFSVDSKRRNGRQPVCKACRAAHHNLHRDRINGRMKDYYRDNRASLAAANKKWRSENREKARENARRWTKANPHKMVASVRRRQLAKINATPAWVNPADILPFYKKAAELTKLHGEPYHVDHIIPLRGETVCGLHVPENLQVIPGRINCLKGNQFDSTVLAQGMCKTDSMSVESITNAG